MVTTCVTPGGSRGGKTTEMVGWSVTMRHPAHVPDRPSGSVTFTSRAPGSRITADVSTTTFTTSFPGNVTESIVTSDPKSTVAPLTKLDTAKITVCWCTPGVRDGGCGLPTRTSSVT